MTYEQILAFILSITAIAWGGIAMIEFNEWVRRKWPQNRYWPAQCDAEIWFAVAPFDLAEYIDPDRIEAYFTRMCEL